MPYTITLNPSLVTVTFSDVVTDQDFRAVMHELRSIVAESPDLDELVDFRAVTSFEVRSGTVRSVADDTVEFGPDSRQAFIAPSDAIYGVTRMFQTLIESKRPNLMVFREANDALLWLKRAA